MVEIIRSNKRGKTLLLLINRKVEVLLRFPTAKDLEDYIKLLKEEGVMYVGPR